MQLGSQLSALRAKHLLYVRAAGVPEGEAAQAAGAFAGTLARLWTLKWENRHKEALWRVAANACWAFPKNDHRRASGMRMPLCRAMDMCDGDRRHRFWDCVVARALRENMAMGAGPESGDACFTRADWCSRLLGWRRRFGMWCVWPRCPPWTWVGSRWLWLVYARVGL